MYLTLLPDGSRGYKRVLLEMRNSLMGGALAIGIGLALGFALLSAEAATKASAPKAPPPCAAITFRPLPSGMTDGEQQAGLYKSRHARLALHAQVKQGEPVDYFVVAAGKRLAPAPTSLPEPAASCAATKKMPAPAATAASCTGQRFTVVVVHTGNERLAMLYGLDGATWRFCSAGTF